MKHPPRAIWKFPLRLVDRQAIAMPRGALVQGVGIADGKAFLFAEVCPDAAPVEKVFRVIATEAVFRAGEMLYVGKVQRGESFLHVFEEVE